MQLLVNEFWKQNGDIEVFNKIADKYKIGILYYTLREESNFVWKNKYCEYLKPCLEQYIHDCSRFSPSYLRTYFNVLKDGTKLVLTLYQPDEKKQWYKFSKNFTYKSDIPIECLNIIGEITITCNNYTDFKPDYDYGYSVTVVEPN